MSIKAARGTKRVCQNCNSKFYDLHRDPITCPICQAIFVQQEGKHKPAPAGNTVEDDDDDVIGKSPAVDIVSLDEVAAEEEVPDLEDSELVVLEDDDTDLKDDEAFIEVEEDDDGGDVSGIVGGREDDEEV